MTNFNHCNRHENNNILVSEMQKIKTKRKNRKCLLEEIESVAPGKKDAGNKNGEQETSGRIKRLISFSGIFKFGGASVAFMIFFFV